MGKMMNRPNEWRTYAWHLSTQHGHFERQHENIHPKRKVRSPFRDTYKYISFLSLTYRSYLMLERRQALSCTIYFYLPCVVFPAFVVPFCSLAFVHHRCARIWCCMISYPNTSASKDSTWIAIKISYWSYIYWEITNFSTINSPETIRSTPIIKSSSQQLFLYVDFFPSSQSARLPACSVLLQNNQLDLGPQNWSSSVVPKIGFPRSKATDSFKLPEVPQVPWYAGYGSIVLPIKERRERLTKKLYVWTSALRGTIALM